MTFVGFFDEFDSRTYIDRSTMAQTKKTKNINILKKYWQKKIMFESMDFWSG